MPETVGFVVADGILVIAAVEVVNLTTDPRELVAVIRASKCFPRSSLERIRVLEIAPAMDTQPAGTWSLEALTAVSHRNH